jgi:RNA polymerase-binding transcription factor DksA
MTDLGAHQALTAEQLVTLVALLDQLEVANQADLTAAENTIATLAAEHATVDPTVHEVMTNAEYMVGDATAILAKIAQAQERIAAGTYGTCIQCGELISFERLELRPYIPTCITCSS